MKLLSPSGRSDSRYRLYSAADTQRLEKICHFRRTGLSLKEIHSLLEPTSGRMQELLERRLQALNDEINRLRDQQAVVIRILKKTNLLRRSRVMTKKSWSDLLRAAGLDDAGMRIWHREFERAAPEAHLDFLRSLRLSSREIARIREWSHQV